MGQAAFRKRQWMYRGCSSSTGGTTTRAMQTAGEQPGASRRFRTRLEATARGRRAAGSTPRAVGRLRPARALAEARRGRTRRPRRGRRIPRQRKKRQRSHAGLGQGHHEKYDTEKMEC